MKLEELTKLGIAEETAKQVVALNETEISAEAKKLADKEAEQGKIVMNSYEDNSPQKLEWIEKTVREEYENFENAEEYRYFLKCKFQL